ncbi:MAG TPA: FAD-linked oxidase C-terminal domain-containing protein [Candidatus Acidoferrales bacterium]|nr:FAD-linked oxidase C-terminal domain-containing protein [Candidatus Acidoferrales bacterium]
MSTTSGLVALETDPVRRERKNPSATTDFRGLEAELLKRIEGEVRFDNASRAIYATDASNYRQVPIGVVIPKTQEDVIETISVCRNFSAPVLSRGGGTSLAGQCCNAAIVIDWSKYLNRMIELNVADRFARVEPGTICDDVVNAGKPYDLTYAPDPATHNHCCFGGMIGNNSCGAHAQMNGPAVDNVESLEILLYDGTRMSVGALSETEWQRRAEGAGREAEIYAGLKALRQKYQGLIEKRYPKIIRRISGYNLDQLIPNEKGMVNIARALVGSEGTCVTILEAKVTLIYNQPERVILVLGYPDVYQAADHLMDILEFKPIALEGIDYRLYQNIQKKGGLHSAHLHLLPDGQGWLIVQFGASTQEEAKETAEKLCRKLGKQPHAPSMKLLVDKKQQKNLWDIREAGLGATAFVPGEKDTWPGWEDSAVAPEKAGRYLRDLRALFNKYHYNPALYGHFGQGCIHCRVDFDLFTEAGVRQYRSFMDEATDLIVSYGGSFSGEHGDGQSRAEFLGKIFGPELMQAFREFKSLWDPDWKMNPGKIIDAYRIDENLRLGPGYNPREPETHFKFPEDNGSFAHATLRCVGVGKCRRLSGAGEQATMCPSFMVTREEKDTTRGRAHALFEMLQGDVIADGWRDDGVKDALDLCLACKGCKGDCPVNVDMATYKAEFLSHYWEGRLRPKFAYAFGWIDKWARLASLAPGLVNLMTQVPFARGFAKMVADVPPERSIPRFAAQTFKAWFKKHKSAPNGGRRVILWPDTFNNFFFPETAIAAVEVLESAGCHVLVPERHFCCGRPLYDYGFLDMAKQYLQDILSALGTEIDRGVPMVVLEPSCCSVFRDELTGLFPTLPRARKLKEQTFTISEFLETQHDFEPPTLKKKALVHGHCHHKAIMRMKDERAIFGKMGLEYQVLDSGCCGMAGSFGFEKNKYQLSVDVGERVLLPAVRRAERSTLLIADGFSCREQIAQLTDRHALHTAEVLSLAMHNPDVTSHAYPESHIVDRREKAQRKSMMKAGLALGALAVAGAAFAFARRK